MLLALDEARPRHEACSAGWSSSQRRPVWPRENSCVIRLTKLDADGASRRLRRNRPRARRGRRRRGGECAGEPVRFIRPPPRSRLDRARGSWPRTTGSPSAGTRSAAKVRARGEVRPASAGSVTASAVALVSASAASGGDNSDGQRAGAGGCARGRVDQVVERPAGPKAAGVATRGRDAAGLELERPEGRACRRGSAIARRHGPPGAAPRTAMSPPRSASPPGSAGHAASIASSARLAAKPLAIPPRSTVEPDCEPGTAGSLVELDFGSRVPAGGRPRLPRSRSSKERS